MYKTTLSVAQTYDAQSRPGKPVEMHIYGKGGHGFGLQKRGQPTDAWILRFEEWMSQQGFLKHQDNPSF